MPGWLACWLAGLLAGQLASSLPGCNLLAGLLASPGKNFCLPCRAPQNTNFCLPCSGASIPDIYNDSASFVLEMLLHERFLGGPEACQTSTSWQAGKLANRPISQSTSWPDSKHQGQQVSQPEPPGQAAKQLADCTANQSLLATFMRTSLQTNGTQCH